MGLIVVGVIGVVALGAGMALAWFVSRGAERRGKAVAMVGGFVFAMLAAIVPLEQILAFGLQPVPIVALLVAALAAAALFFLTGREVKWGGTRVLALFGIGLMCMMLMLMFAIGMESLGDYPIQAARFAQKEGFAVLLPGWLPAMGDVEGFNKGPPGGARISLQYVGLLSLSGAPDDAGVILQYNGGLMICERKKGTGLSLAQLESELPTDVVRTRTTIKGQPALLVEYKDRTKNPLAGEVWALFFETDGVTVNMGGLRKEQLVKVAESLTAR